RQQEMAASKLEEGERTRFDLGDSTLLVVNLREIAHGDAALLQADAATTVHKAQADFRAALGGVAPEAVMGVSENRPGSPLSIRNRAVP
ncbi:MAG: TolC-like outerrane protein, partial [Proteobacteria bacterium]|nr:TolC-like outerrane protein [Pseudomonadota bacterium]